MDWLFDPLPTEEAQIEIPETNQMNEFKMTIEVEVNVKYTPIPEEPRTHDYPGYPAYIEDLTVSIQGKELDHEKLAKDFEIDFDEACWDDVEAKRECHADRLYDEMKDRKFELTNWRKAS